MGVAEGGAVVVGAGGAEGLGGGGISRAGQGMIGILIDDLAGERAFSLLIGLYHTILTLR
jgi:hypothetical protein